jgi:hypothetical protein
MFLDFAKSKTDAKTWFIDLDGVLAMHNQYKNNNDEIIEGTNEVLEKIPQKDIIIITTARPYKYKISTIKILKENNIRFDSILFGLNSGLRLLINDKKPDGTLTAKSINLNRNEGIKSNKTISEHL